MRRIFRYKDAVIKVFDTPDGYVDSFICFNKRKTRSMFPADTSYTGFPRQIEHSRMLVDCILEYEEIDRSGWDLAIYTEFSLGTYNKTKHLQRIRKKRPTLIPRFKSQSRTITRDDGNFSHGEADLQS